MAMKHSFHSAEDYRDHLPCQDCEPIALRTQQSDLNSMTDEQRRFYDRGFELGRQWGSLGGEKDWDGEDMTAEPFPAPRGKSWRRGNTAGPGRPEPWYDYWYLVDDATNTCY